MSAKHRGELVRKAWLYEAIPESGRTNDMIDTKEPMLSINRDNAWQSIKCLLEYVHQIGDLGASRRPRYCERGYTRN
jgi:hypothetical protein